MGVQPVKSEPDTTEPFRSVSGTEQVEREAPDARLPFKDQED